MTTLTHIGWSKNGPGDAMGHRSPPNPAAPNKVAAFSRSAEISFSLSLRAFSRGSRTASSSYSRSSSPSRAARAALAASFSANLALSVPFFFGGATGAGVGLVSSSSSSEDASQSLWVVGSQDGGIRGWRGWAYGGLRSVFVFAFPFALDGFHWHDGGCGCGCVVRAFCARGGW